MRPETRTKIEGLLAEIEALAEVERKWARAHHKGIRRQIALAQIEVALWPRDMRRLMEMDLARRT